MPEILTESFCERCGTRYTFESVAPRKTRRLGQFKTLSKGVRNWVMSDDSSLDEALAAARSDEEREVTSQQLDAFHSTFNFCMNCRQYTCANCWNPADGRCLTCAPNLGQEILPAPFPNAAAFEPVRMDAEAWPEVDLAGGAATGASGLDVAAQPASADGNGFHAHDLVASSNGTPEEPLPDVDATARLAFLAALTGGDAPIGPTAEAPAGAADANGTARLAWPDEATLEPELAATNDVELAPAATEAEAPVAFDAEPDVAEAGEAAETAGTSPEPTIVDADQRAAELASRTSVLLGRFRPGQNLDAEIAAYEARLEAEEAQLVPEPEAAGEREVAVEPEAVAATAPVAEPETALTAEPERDPVPAAQPVEESLGAASPVEESIAAELQPEPAAATSESPATPPARDDVVEQPTWRIFAPDQTSPQPGAPGTGAPVGTPIQASADPQWPARPEAEESPSMALFANRDRVSSDALWAASAREVLGGPIGPTPAPTLGVQPCSNCGLSLSANARFCRRCGTRQS